MKRSYIVYKDVKEKQTFLLLCMMKVKPNIENKIPKIYRKTEL